MKISKKQLKRIIAEEKKKLLETEKMDNLHYGSDEYDFVLDQIDAQLRRAVYKSFNEGIKVKDIEVVFQDLINEFYYGK